MSKQTLQSHGYRLQRFVEWCDETGIDNLNDVTGRSVHRYKLWRGEQVNQTTLKSSMDTLRVALRFWEAIAVRDGVAESVRSPRLERVSVGEKDVVKERKANRILAYLSKYEYASIEHVTFRLLWETGARVGAIRANDTGDVHHRAEYIEFHHRPESDTPLKNWERGERHVSLSTTTVNILRDYIDQHRHDVEDEHGRSPLLTSKHGRATVNTLRSYSYRVTRPCSHGVECPHDRDPNDCEAVQSRMSASKCLSSSGTHSVRRGAITHFLDSDTRADVVSDRMDVSKPEIDEFYDSRTEREKMDLRRRYIDHL